MPLVINIIGEDIRTHTVAHEQKGFQETKHVQPAAVSTWFKNYLQKFISEYFVTYKLLVTYSSVCMSIVMLLNYE